MSKLHDHLTRTGASQSQFAADIGVSRGHMSAILSGERKPSLDLAVAIERATDGAVPASSWVPEPADLETKGAA